MDNTENIISLCTGYGGLDEGIRMGAELQGRRIREVAYVEIEAFAVANLVAKMEKGAIPSVPVWTNLKTFNAEPFRGKVHGIIGGYPCQPFSMAGQRQGTEDPRHLWPYIREIVNTIRPVWCFFENVSGHISLGYEEVYQSLRDIGYSVEAGLYTAAEVGAPHKRERLFILAYSKNKRLSRCGESHNTKQRQEYPRKRDGVQCWFADTSVDGEPAELDNANSNATAEIGGDTTETSKIKKREGRAEHSTAIPGGAGAEESAELADLPESGLSFPGFTEQRKLQAEERERLYNRPEQCCNGEPTELADSDSSRRGKDRQSTELRATGIEQSFCYCGSAQPCEGDQRRCVSKWPSRPGEPQYKWEHPRTATKEEIKSAMGLPVDGPGFREDLLRALGNGVVPQQAAKAWIELWNEASH